MTLATTAAPPRVESPTVPAPPWPGRLWPLVRAVPAVVVVLALNLGRLGDRSLWSDEYATWYAARLGLPDLIRLLDQVDSVLGPYYLAMHAWVDVFGPSETSLRMPSLLAMAASAALLSMLGERLVNRWVGVAGGLVFASLPTVSRYAQEARPYGLATAFTLVATAALITAIDRPTWGWWLRYGLAMTVLGLVHVVALLCMLPHALAVALAGRRRPDFRLWRSLAAFTLVVTAALPFAVKGSSEKAAIGWIRAGFGALREFPGKLAGSASLAIIITALAVFGVALLYRSRRDTALMLAAWAGAPIALTYATFPLLHLFLHRYLLFTLPAWCLLAAAGAYELGRRLPALVGWRHGRGPATGRVLAALLVMAAVVVLGAVGRPAQIAVRQDPVFAEPDFRSAAHLVAAQQQAGDGVAFATFRNGRRALAYELRGQPAPRDVFLETPSRQVGGFAAIECHEPGGCVLDTQRIWLLTSDLSGADPYRLMPKAIAALLRDEFTPRRRWAFPNISVVLLVRTA